MKIEVGKCYVTRDGRKVGPMEPPAHLGTSYRFRGQCGDHSRIYQADGTHGGFFVQNDPDVDLVAEWSEGPVREVTRREIVPGVYDRLEVVASDKGGIHVRLAARGGITLTSNSTHVLNRAELDTLIANLTALRDVL